MFKPEKIRNIAIIAHIDHGKTTLLDSLLKQSEIFHDNAKIPERIMDNYDQEKERGITIFSKHTSIFFEDFKINIIDTPGHADFAGEVERILGMVDSVLLLIDAKEGPMPQTRFVLMKSLQMGICPIVVLNKIDRPHADPERVLNEVFDLFVELNASDKQLDFSYCYASGLTGYAMMDLNDEKKDMNPLFKLIIKSEPKEIGDIDSPFLMQVATIEYDDYVGRQACGRILNGKIQKNQIINHTNQNGCKSFKIQRIENHHGLNKVEMEEAGVGDIVIISGCEDVTIGDTLSHKENKLTLPPIVIAEPTLSIDIMVNSGPLAGKDGKNLTINKIRERLLKEKKSNVTLKIEISEGAIDKITVSGRGELHLAVLLEALRRENFEFLVSKPQVIIKEIDNQKCEPIEEAHIEVPNEFSGVIIQELGIRRGEIKSLVTNDQDITKMDFLIPTRGLMGCHSEFLTLTKGLIIMSSIFDHYTPLKGSIPGRKRGVLVSLCAGDTNGYACFGLQKRAVLFVKPTDKVYEGMIVGENSKENDLVVNAVKGKQLSNMRASGKDESIILTPSRSFTLEEAISYIEDDELIEITPKHIRLRKKHLSEVDRKRASRASTANTI
ncbi:MAG: GTP-binding protein TypA/BipA [Candidatus Anoxychlamydiales bacterium]|nr:GTP-binding protein TypA/BipA [Candidatus Anoxychlamydiales bacterium]